jgi:predicted anti-sigma-YlaC factor YlaD
MTCAEFDVLLCDYLDGTLRGEDKTSFELHRSSCVACAEYADEVAGAVAFVERVATVEPPAELMTRILHDAPHAGSRVGSSEKRSWAQRIFGGLFESVLQPRYAMGMAMTILSFSMVARFAGIEPRQLTPADLDPVKIWSTMDDHAHRTWDRAVKYYDNLRLVIEVQSRLKEFSDQEQAQQDSGKEVQNKK